MSSDSDKKYPSSPNRDLLYLSIAALLILGGAVRIALTHQVFSQTFDEPAHIACGMQWLDEGTYEYEHQHPPLARVFAALGPYLRGLRSNGLDDMWKEGNAILHSRDDYDNNLQSARLGILLFFITSSALVFGLGAILYGKPAALAATFLFTALPPVLAHSGLATTDMAITATLTGAVFAFLFWLRQPNLKRAVVLGVAGAAALLSKFSALLFFPAAVIIPLGLYLYSTRSSGVGLARITRDRVSGLAIACLVAFAIVWAGYRFDVGPIIETNEMTDRRMEILPAAVKTLLEAPVPAPAMVRGPISVFLHSRGGHNTYLLGEFRTTGWWYFFPLALGVKTPLAFLLLFVIGGVALVRSTAKDTAWLRLAPLVGAISILLVCLPSKLNLGVRHILPMYPMLALIAGYGVITLLQQTSRRWLGSGLAIALLGWLSISSLRAHPDYLAYFNEFVMREPERVLVDSDLDWGQDLKRLSRKLKDLGAKQVYLDYYGRADLARHGLPELLEFDQEKPPHEWVAIGLSRLKHRQQRYRWLNNYEPVAKAGKSINIYYIP